MTIKRLKTILVVLQVIPLIAAVALGMATAAVRANAISEDAIIAAALAIVYVPYLASVVLSGVLASRLRRSVLGWVLATFFLPLFGPIILVTRGSLDRPVSQPDPVRVPADRAASRARAPEVLPASRIIQDDAFNPGGFCRQCQSETTDERPGNVRAVNGIGTTLMGTRWRGKGLRPCPVCGSVVQTKWFTFGFGVKPLGTYRVIYTKKGLTVSRFFARRLRHDGAGG